MALVNKSPATAYLTTDVLYPGPAAEATALEARALTELGDLLSYKNDGTAITVSGGNIDIAPA